MSSKKDELDTVAKYIPAMSNSILKNRVEADLEWYIKKARADRIYYF